MHDPLLGALGLCRKAGKLLTGHDRVLENALQGKVFLVLLAADASGRTARGLQTNAAPCRRMPLTMAQLAALTPKPTAVFGVTDPHLAELCAKHCPIEKEEPVHGV